jgi:hypothetical protein
MKSKLVSIASVANLVFFIFYLFAFTKKNNDAIISFEDKILKVRGLVVVDSLGIERVIVGAPLPTAQTSFGNRVYPREKGAGVYGVMIYDAEGQERGGYVTDDDYGNAFLTLDSKTGQNFLVIAEPNGPAALQLWDRKGKNKISLETFDDGADIKLKRNSQDVKIYKDEK